MSDNTASGGGISGITVLGIVFVVLKLTGVIDWSWWWVLLPFYGGLILFLAVLILGAVGIGLFHGTKALFNRRK